MNKQKIFVPAVIAAILLLGITVGIVFGGPFIASAHSKAAGTATPTTPATRTTTNPYCELYLKDLANRLHVSVTTLEQAQLAAHEDVLARLVHDGKLTQSQANAIKQRLTSHPTCAGKKGEMHYSTSRR